MVILKICKNIKQCPGYSLLHLKYNSKKKIIKMYKIVSKCSFKIELKVKVNVGNAYAAEFYRLKHMEVNFLRIFSVSYV